MTDENGLFKLENVPAGTHTMKIVDIEQKPLSEVTIKVKAGKVTNKDIKLTYDVGGKGCCGDSESEEGCADCEDSQAQVIGTLSNIASSVTDLFSIGTAHAVYPCRDYTGPLGNCVNYSSGTGRYVNFIMSD